MNEAQRAALADVLGDARDQRNIARRRTITRVRGGRLLVVILALTVWLIATPQPT